MRHNVSRVIFMPEDGRGNSFVNCMANDAYIYSATDFCKNFTAAAFRWCEANKNEEPVISNMERLMQYRPGGVAPYIRAPMVLA